MSEKYPITGEYKGLPLVPIKTAIKDAKVILEEERDGKQRGLYCRFNKINIGMLRYWRFGYNTLIAGMSGSGKSYLLNALHDDFTNPELNGNCIYGLPIILHFSFEMDGSDEVIRNVGSKIGKSYSYLLSSENIKSTNTYNRLSDEEYKAVLAQLVKLENRGIIYTRGSGNRVQMYNTIYHVKNLYPTRPLIITTDHSHLVKKLDERNDLELIAELAQDEMKWMNDFEDPMIIDLGQLNTEIEDIKRRENPALHYPIKSDIHGSQQMFWAKDNVMIAHRPEIINLKTYGVNKLDTTDLIHIALIKTRFGRPANILLKSELAQGRIVEYTQPIQLLGIK